MIYVYKITNKQSDRFYIGITNNLIRRRLAHIQSAKRGKKTSLYAWMRKHNLEFEIVVLQECETRQEACELEKELILVCREIGLNILNIADGGDGGFVVSNIEDWKSKLSVSRKGRTPAKGMKHSKENKELFKMVSKEYWDGKDTYSNKADEILKLSHKEAKKVYGISTTHYYRLRNRLGSNESK